MKKTYATPSLVVRGNAVVETNAGSPISGETGSETNRQVLSSIGSVGYYL